MTHAKQNMKSSLATTNKIPLFSEKKKKTEGERKKITYPLAKSLL